MFDRTKSVTTQIDSLRRRLVEIARGVLVCRDVAAIGASREHAPFIEEIDRERERLLTEGVALAGDLSAALSDLGEAKEEVRRHREQEERDAKQN